jgi:hypothetical protein
LASSIFILRLEGAPALGVKWPWFENIDSVGWELIIIKKNQSMAINNNFGINEQIGVIYENN